MQNVVQSIELNDPPKLAGSTWITLYQNQDWPVVLCNERTTPPKFYYTYHNNGEVPGILLGKHKYIWVFPDGLVEFDPLADYSLSLSQFGQPEIMNGDNEFVISEEQRRKAFLVDAMHFEDDKFWCNYVVQKSQARKLENARKSQPSSFGVTKRSFSLENDGMSITGESPSHWKSTLTTRSDKSGRKDSFISSQYPSEDETPPRKRNKSSHSSSGTSCSRSDEKSGPSTTPVIVLDGPKGKRSTARRTPPVMSEDMVKIFVDKSQCGTIIPRSALHECDYLASLEYRDQPTGDHIVDLTIDSRALELNLKEKEFERLYDYFYTNQIGPELLPGKTYDSEKPFGDLTDYQKSTYVQDLSLAFIPASKLQHTTLQDLIRDKIRALVPIPPLALLIMATIFSKLPPPETTSEFYMQEWIVDHVAANFEVLERDHREQFAQKMAQDEALWKAVADRHGRSGAASVEVLDED